MRNSLAGESPLSHLGPPKLPLLLLLHCSYTASRGPTLHSLVDCCNFYAFFFRVDASLTFLGHPFGPFHPESGHEFYQGRPPTTLSESKQRMAEQRGRESFNKKKRDKRAIRKCGTSAPCPRLRPRVTRHTKRHSHNPCDPKNAHFFHRNAQVVRLYMTMGASSCCVWVAFVSTPLDHSMHRHQSKQPPSTSEFICRCDSAIESFVTPWM